jgi:hypothetical protein
LTMPGAVGKAPLKRYEWMKSPKPTSFFKKSNKC